MRLAYRNIVKPGVQFRMEFYFRSLARVSATWKWAYRRACIEAGVTPAVETPGAERRLALYDLYLALVMVVEVAYRGYGPEHAVLCAWRLDCG